MGHSDNMTIIKDTDTYSIGLMNDPLYNSRSADNARTYKRLYAAPEYLYYNSRLNQHGIFLFKAGKLENSVCICAPGGHTGIHPTCAVSDGHRLLLCCGDTIFCLTVPELDLSWLTTADTATCFEIFRHDDGYIVHGELEISRLNIAGAITWRFSGSDIFTTPSGKDEFAINGNQIRAVCWNGQIFHIDARTGNLI